MQTNRPTDSNYNAALLAYAMQRKDLNEYQAAKLARIAPSSVNAALAGNLGTIKKLRKLADSLEIVWKHLFDVELPESQFRRAVSNGKRG